MLPRSDVPLSCWQLQCSRVADFRPGEDLSVLKWKKRATRIKIISFDLLNADFQHICVQNSFEFLVPTFISWRSRSSRRRWRKDLLKSWGDGRCHWSGRSRIDLEKIKSSFFLHTSHYVSQQWVKLGWVMLCPTCATDFLFFFHGQFNWIKCEEFTLACPFFLIM